MGVCWRKVETLLDAVGGDSASSLEADLAPYVDLLLLLLSKWATFMGRCNDEVETVCPPIKLFSCTCRLLALDVANVGAESIRCSVCRLVLLSLEERFLRAVGELMAGESQVNASKSLPSCRALCELFILAAVSINAVQMMDCESR